jgi:hypothetical protein
MRWTVVVHSMQWQDTKWTARIWFPVGDGNLSSPLLCPDQFWGKPNHLSDGNSFPGGEVGGIWGDHSPPCSAVIWCLGSRHLLTDAGSHYHHWNASNFVTLQFWQHLFFHPKCTFCSIRDIVTLFVAVEGLIFFYGSLVYTKGVMHFFISVMLFYV